MSMWYEQETLDNSSIISSRVRLARNLAAYPFSVQLGYEKSCAIIDEISVPLSDEYMFIALDKEDKITRLSMLEAHEISPDVLKSGVERPFALLKSHDRPASIMLGEEDHIRIQAIAAGNNLDEAYAQAKEVDERLESLVNYAYHKDFGYLTSCPTNTGTGLRASFMVHIPMIEKTGSLPNLVKNLSKLGLTVRGIYGEGSNPCGSIYQVSNQVTLGKSESEIIEQIKTIGAQLIESEQALLQSAFTKSQTDMEDVIYRAIGLLSHARKLALNETMESLSAIKVGLLSGVLKKGVCSSPVYAIMIAIQPGNIQKKAGSHLSDRDIEIYRARYLRKIFG